MKKAAYARVKAWRESQGEKLREIRREEAKRRRERHPERVRAGANAWIEKNRDKVRQQNTASARRRRADKEANALRSREFKARRLAELENETGRSRPTRCELCQEEHPKIVFDHCHAHGHFRGWICDRCNKVLGLVKDSAPLLARMSAYLDHAAKSAPSVPITRSYRLTRLDKQTSMI